MRAFNRSWQRYNQGFGFSQTERGKSMSISTAHYIGQIMELGTQKGLESVIRVLPAEPRNDIGFAIMSQFHYSADVRIVTRDSLEEARDHLAE